MVDFAHDPKTGQEYMRTRTGDWVPVTKEQADIASEGALEGFARSAGNSAAQLYGGLGAIIGDQQAADLLPELQAAQAIRQRERPLSSTLGGVAPDIAAGIVTGGGSLPASIGRTAIVEGALGAMRNPEAPISGALIQGGLGAVGGAAVPLVARGVGALRGKQLAEDAIEGVKNRHPGAYGLDESNVKGGPGSVSGVSTQEARDAAQQGFQARTFGRFFSDAEPDTQNINLAKTYGFRLTPADEVGSVAMKNYEAALESQPFAQSAFEELRNHNNQRMNQFAAKAMGLDENTRLLPDAIAEAREKAEDQITQAIGPSRKIDTEPAKARVRQSVNAKGFDDVSRFVAGYMNEIPHRANAGQLFKRINTMRSDAFELMGNNQTQKGEALLEAAESLFDEMMSRMPRQARRSVEDARERFMFASLLERGNRINPDGDVSTMSTYQAMKNSKYLKNRFQGHKSGERELSDDGQMFVNAIQTMAAFRDRVGNSGTATRSAFGASPKELALGALGKAYLNPAGAATGGIAALGGYSLLGGP